MFFEGTFFYLYPMRTYRFIGVILLLASCAPSRFVEPLDKNQWAVGANVGGPMIGFGGAVIPVPLTAIEVGYGIDTNLTVHGGLHTTALLFGNIQLDAGATYQFIEQRRFIPNVSVSPGFNLTTYVSNVDANDVRTKFWPTLDVNAYWNYGQRRNYFYAGFNNYFELSKTMANDQAQAHPWLFSPQIGHITKGKNRSWELTTELKFLAPNVQNTYAFVPYRSLLGKYGATGVYLGFRKIISQKNKR